MAKVQLEPVLNIIETIQVFTDIYPCCEYDETQQQLFLEIKSKINQLDRVVRLIKNNYEKELAKEKLSPEERNFEEFIERNKKEGE